MAFSYTILGFYAFLLIYLIHIGTVSAIPLSRDALEEPTGFIEPELGSETQTDGEGLQNTGVVPGLAFLVGGALEHGQGFPSEAGKAITKSLGDSASADGGGAASTVVNLPNTGYTVLKAADDDPGVVGKTSHVLFGGKVETRANTA